MNVPGINYSIARKVICGLPGCRRTFRVMLLVRGVQRFRCPHCGTKYRTSKSGKTIKQCKG